MCSERILKILQNNNRLPEKRERGQDSALRFLFGCICRLKKKVQAEMNIDPDLHKILEEFHQRIEPLV